MNHEHLIIFVKAPRVGQVKTRLAATIGAEAACAAYRQIVETLFSHLSSFAEVELRFMPDDAGEEIKPWLHDGWWMRPQGQGDLGMRLQRAFAEAFQKEAQRAVIIGSDCPEVEATDIREAWTALDDYELVLGPATDGGYWLIGLCHEQAMLFENMPWSSDRVLRETLARAQSAGLSARLLRRLSDVDTEADWRKFVARAKGT
jgi:hypothetical protein